MEIIYPYPSLDPMMRIVKNRILDAALKFILLTALVHLGILAAYSLLTWDLSVWNYFNILDLSLFIPGISIGPASWIVSGAIIVLLFLAIFLFFAKSGKRTAKRKKPVIAAKAKQLALSAVRSPKTE